MKTLITLLTLALSVHGKAVEEETTKQVCFSETQCFTQDEFALGIHGSSVYLDFPFRASCNYCMLGQGNTYCLFQNNQEPSSTCGNRNAIVSGVSAAERQKILDIHNNYRRNIATGKETRMSRFGTASDMFALSWNDELAFGAQLWANQCQFKHDYPKICAYDWLGQNLFISWAGSNSGTEPDWNKAISSWYEEIVDFTGPVTNFGFNPATGHFTQIIWSRTKEIGCGYITYDDSSLYAGRKKYYVCNYGPGGNMVGDNIYKSGPSCSACPSGSSCSDNLCVSGSTGGSTGGLPTTTPNPVTTPAPPTTTTQSGIVGWFPDFWGTTTPSPTTPATTGSNLPLCKDICRNEL